MCHVFIISLCLIYGAEHAILGKVDVMINDTHSYLNSQMNRGSL